jgi:ZIP family zinc transporter
MDPLANLLFVFVAGFVSAVTTGAGALPFFFISDVSDRVRIVLWGVASGVMVAASTFGLIFEGVAAADSPAGYLLIVGGLVGGAGLVVVADEVLDRHEFDPRDYEEADFRQLVLILGVMTVHSFPEGIAIGVAFAELNLAEGFAVGPFVVPVLGVFMTVAIAVQNVPEGVAVSIPLQTAGVSNWKTVWWAVFSSLPQPVGAVFAFAFVRIALDFLPAGFGIAAGAMIYLVVTEFIPEALEFGADRPGGGRRILAFGFIAGVVAMLPLVFLGG